MRLLPISSTPQECGVHRWGNQTVWNRLSKPPARPHVNEIGIVRFAAGVVAPRARKSAQPQVAVSVSRPHESTVCGGCEAVEPTRETFVVLFGNGSHRLGQASRSRPELAADTDELVLEGSVDRQKLRYVVASRPHRGSIHRLAHGSSKHRRSHRGSLC